ncbi:hypothetical protein BBR47_06450 [Brevibacillus brevis NBRC 100599]|uniref:Uncharacterized protein n=1 Tax=Brevibacillus brevis (strain 47 / JCM 6285 / NBRC 100599) TaxID=358681 RepID=C0Z495_BREBN|nr:hypothetical protein BBR47_06450 [Brevibacillus brevis NBRC 100599]
MLKGVALARVAMTAAEFLDGLNTDWVQPMFMSDTQRQSRVLENQKGLVDKITSIDKMPPGLKHLFFVDTAITGIKDSLINLLGGTTPSFSDYYNAFEAASKYDDKDLTNELDNTFQLDKKEAQLEFDKYKAANKKREEKDKNSLLIDIDDSGSKLDNTPITSWEEVKTLDLGKEVVGHHLESLSLEEGKLRSELKRTQATLRNQGKSEDSPEILKAYDDYYSGINTKQNEHLAFFEEVFAKIPKGSDASDVVDSVIADIKASIAQNNLDKNNHTSGTKIKSAMSKVSSDLENKEHQYYIDRSEAVLAGHSSNSEFMKNLEEKYLRSTIDSLDAGNSDMDSLLAEYQNNETLKKIIEDFKKGLEKAKYDNLVSLHMSKQPTKGTFNMPDGLQPLTYWGMQTANGTHSTYDFTYGGDSNVNITIANMSGTEADLQRLGSTVSEAVRNTQASLSTELSQQVRSGIATSYTRL